jgi:hydroxymethylglutaryl-CoA lyase
VLSALVPNLVGMQGVLDANRAAQRRLLSKVAVFTAASETFSQKNANATIAQTLERFRPVITTARTEGLMIRGYISCAIACPFEGPIAPRAVIDVGRSLIDLGVDEIDLGDTIGAGTRDSIATLVSQYRREIPIVGGRILTTLHLHDTFARAADCVRAALDLGVRSFDGSVAGVGGCPYASTPTRRAPGNISTELLVRTVEEAGFQTGVDMDRLKEAAAYASGIVAKSRAGTGGAT